MKRLIFACVLLWAMPSAMAAVTSEPPWAGGGAAAQVDPAPVAPVPVPRSVECQMEPAADGRPVRLKDLLTAAFRCQPVQPVEVEPLAPLR